MDKFAELVFTFIACATVLLMIYAFNHRIEMLECRLQVQTARIDLLNGLEITRPECLDELLGPAKERKAQPTKQT